MLLLRSISQSCINTLHESLTILAQARFDFSSRQNNENDLIRTSDHEPITVVIPSGSSTAIINTSTRPASQSVNINPNGRSSLTVGLSSQSNLFNSQNRMSRYLLIFTLQIIRNASSSSLNAMTQQNESNFSVINHGDTNR